MAHFEYSGLQSHSVGGLYPWSVVIRCRQKTGVVYAMNLVKGQKLAEYPYNCDSHASYMYAASRAEEDCYRAVELEKAERQLFADRKLLVDLGLPADGSQPNELTVCRLIIPILRGSDGTPHRTELWDFIYNYFCDVFGGVTTRACSGGWRDHNGKVIHDKSTEFEAAGSPEAVTNLITRPSEFAETFDQECVYVAIGATAKLYYRPIR